MPFVPRRCGTFSIFPDQFSPRAAVISLEHDYRSILLSFFLVYGGARNARA